jgi:hypothetical protein
MRIEIGDISALSLGQNDIISYSQNFLGHFSFAELYKCQFLEIRKVSDLKRDISSAD